MHSRTAFFIAVILIWAPSFSWSAPDPTAPENLSACKIALTALDGPISKVLTLRDIHTQAELDELVRQNDDLIQKGYDALKVIDPLLDDAMKVVRSHQPVATPRNANRQRYKSNYHYLVIDPSKIPAEATSEFAVKLRRTSRLHPKMMVYIDPLINKAGESYGFFEPSIEKELALFLDEHSLKNFVLGFAFDGTLRHEGDHLSFEDLRRRNAELVAELERAKGLPAATPPKALPPVTHTPKFKKTEPIVYDYNLSARLKARASHLEGYEEYLNLEEFYTWVGDLMDAAKAIRRPTPGKLMTELMDELKTQIDSFKDLVVNHPDNGVLRVREILDQVAEGKIPLSSVKAKFDPDSGLEFTYGDYTLINTNPWIMAEYKSIVYTNAGKMKMVKLFAHDMKKVENAIVLARQKMLHVETAYQDLFWNHGTDPQISEYSLPLLHEVKKVQDVFIYFLPQSPLH